MFAKTCSTKLRNKCIRKMHIPPYPSSVFCCRAGSGYPNGYPVLGNSRGGFPLPSSRFVITYCDQSFPSPWHWLSAAPLLSGATLLSTLEGIPLSITRGRGGRRSAPAVCQSLTSADPTIPPYGAPKKSTWCHVQGHNFAVPGGIAAKFQKTFLGYWQRQVPNFMLICDVPVEKTVTEQNKHTVP